MFARLPHDLQRLRLRALLPEDLAAFHAYRSDPAVARYQGWAPMTRDAAHEFLRAESMRSGHAPGTWRQLAVAERTTDRLVGDMGVWLAPDSRRAEFGLTITPAVQGRGYGTECVRGLVALLFDATAVAEIIASTDARNAPCLALLARVGMREVAVREAVYKGEACTERVFALRRRGLQPGAAGAQAGTGSSG